MDNRLLLIQSIKIIRFVYGFAKVLKKVVVTYYIDHKNFHQNIVIYLSYIL